MVTSSHGEGQLGTVLLCLLSCPALARTAMQSPEGTFQSRGGGAGDESDGLCDYALEMYLSNEAQTLRSF